ncbi:glycosyltransferase family protein [bacterium]|nr:glycosyltransferase family protein [bacterium]
MNIGIILQARMGSTRLPGKVLKKIWNKTLLEHIFYRLTFLKHDVKLVLATSVNPKDDAIEVCCNEHAVDCFRGSEGDVLKRFYLCAKKYGFQHIIRLTGDNPFTDIEELDNLIDMHLKEGADYSHSFGVLPVGVGAEIVNFSSLEKSFHEGQKPNHREHVNEYIQEHPELFKISVLSVPEEKNMPDVRLTVDTEEDYLKACFIVQECSDEFVTTDKAIEQCSRYV